MQVVSFVDYTPAARYDEIAWTSVRVEEADFQDGPWTTIDTQTLSPEDTDPARPMSRSLTTDDASDDMGLWYRLVWVDPSGALSPTLPVQNQAPETLSATALCSDEDVRLYLGIKGEDLSEDDRNTIVRLVNAASDTFTDESQRIWRLDPSLAGARLYRLDSFDLQVGRLRIDDCTAVTSVGYGDFRDQLGPTSLADESWGVWQEEPGYPISAIVLVEGLLLEAGNVLTIDADWGWPAVPEKVRQAVIYTAAEWYARDVEKFSATFSLDQGRILMPQVLPSQVQREAESYRRWRVA
jgi:hypothetical protein